MKDKRHIKRFNESQENLNISDVIDSISFNENDVPITFEINKNGDLDILTDSDFTYFLKEDEVQKLFNILKKYYL
jgi:hypothetical protein